MDIVPGVFILVLALCLYGFPAILAYSREHHQRLAILWLTILAGWSVVGWVVAFVWACTLVRPATSRSISAASF